LVFDLDWIFGFLGLDVFAGFVRWRRIDNTRIREIFCH